MQTHHVFLKHQAAPNSSSFPKDLQHDLSDWFLILNCFKKSSPQIEESIYWESMLGITSRVFQLLLKNKSTEEVLTVKWKESVCTAIYSNNGPKLMGTNSLEECIIIFSHCYEHVRQQLQTIGWTTLVGPLEIKPTDKNQPWFANFFNFVNSSQVPTKLQLLERLAKRKARFHLNIKYLKENRNCFNSNTSSSDQVIGHYLGNEFAYMSADVSSLLETPAMELTSEEIELIHKNYSRYRLLGNSYRFQSLNVLQLLVRCEFSFDTKTPMVEVKTTIVSSLPTILPVEQPKPLKETQVFLQAKKEGISQEGISRLCQRIDGFVSLEKCSVGEKWIVTFEDVKSRLFLLNAKTITCEGISLSVAS